MITQERLGEIKKFVLRHFEATELGYWKIFDNEWQSVPFEECEYEWQVDKLEEQFFFGDLGLCGCYLPNDVREMLLEVLITCDTEDFKTDEDWEQKFKKTQEWLGSPFAQFTFYVLDDKGYLEHGSSIGGCWTTHKGRMYAEILSEYLRLESEGE